MRFYFILLCALNPFYAYAQQAYVNDDDVSTIFVSGGYGALFGAAMGAAMLPFMNNSATQNLRIVAGGASLGFMLGSAYGFYSLANSKRNSYFNYNNPMPDDDGTYYSMPPTMPTQGNNIKSNSNKSDYSGKASSNTPLIGALFMGDGKNINLGVPFFWITSDKQVSVLLAAVTF